jgi:alpha-D-ribose 1-methylphosphonate 5-triphosphate synthase subunit PhnL
MIRIENLSKSFTLHNQGSAVIPVMAGASLNVAPGECVGLTGQSGAGKSTLMRMVYGNYLIAGGRLIVGDTDVATAEPRQIIALRRHTLGYVSQFLRVVPRVPTLEVVAEPLLALGTRPIRPATGPPAFCAASTSPNGSGRCRPPPSRAGNSSG